jgi:hypothetical protein
MSVLEEGITEQVQEPVEQEITEWLVSLGLVGKTRRKAWLGEISSGVLLVRLVQKLGKLDTFPGTYLRPKSLTERQANLQR